MSLDVVVTRVRYFPAKKPHAPLSIAEVPLLSDWVLPWLIPDLSTRLAARLLRLMPNNFLSTFSMKLDKLLFSDFASATSLAFSDRSSLNDTVVSFTTGMIRQEPLSVAHLMAGRKPRSSRCDQNAHGVADLESAGPAGLRRGLHDVNDPSLPQML